MKYVHFVVLEGKVFTRKSEREYTHVICGRYVDPDSRSHHHIPKEIREGVFDIAWTSIFLFSPVGFQNLENLLVREENSLWK